MLTQLWLWVRRWATRHSCITVQEQNSLLDPDLADKRTEGPEEALSTNSEHREVCLEEVMSTVGVVRVRTIRGTVWWRDTWCLPGLAGAGIT